jgi:hypothetical protein
MKGLIFGYGRYDDDPSHIGCPRAQTDMSPCAARDGSMACDPNGACIDCRIHPADELRALVRVVTDPDFVARVVEFHRAVGELRDVFRQDEDDWTGKP